MEMCVDCTSKIKKNVYLFVVRITMFRLQITDTSNNKYAVLFPCILMQ
jgi:hypothetical protein